MCSVKSFSAYYFHFIFLSPVLCFSFYLICFSLSLTFPLPPLLSLVPFVLFSFNKVTYPQGYCIASPLHLPLSLSLLSRHGGHPAAPSLACWIQSEQCGRVRAGRQHALPRHEAFVHVRLRLDLLLFCPVLTVALLRYLHLPQRCGLQPQSAAERRAPDQPGLHKHAQLQDGAGHAK